MERRSSWPGAWFPRVPTNDLLTYLGWIRNKSVTDDKGSRDSSLSLESPGVQVRYYVNDLWGLLQGVIWYLRSWPYPYRCSRPRSTRTFFWFKEHRKINSCVSPVRSSLSSRRRHPGEWENLVCLVLLWRSREPWFTPVPLGSLETPDRVSLREISTDRLLHPSTTSNQCRFDRSTWTDDPGLPFSPFSYTKRLVRVTTRFLLHLGS